MNSAHSILVFRRSRARGVTLIELIVVMLILSVLSTIAVSSYRNYVLRANRTDAKQALLRIQVGEEKYFLQRNTYTTNIVDPMTPAPGGLGMGSNTTAGGYYTLAVVGDAAGIATSYIATATATGGQTKDNAACLTLSINDRGAKTPAESTGCWK